jgi:hypothetical protein
MKKIKDTQTNYIVRYINIHKTIRHLNVQYCILILTTYQKHTSTCKKKEKWDCISGPGHPIIADVTNIYKKQSYGTK